MFQKFKIVYFHVDDTFWVIFLLYWLRHALKILFSLHIDIQMSWHLCLKDYSPYVSFLSVLSPSLCLSLYVHVHVTELSILFHYSINLSILMPYQMTWNKKFYSNVLKSETVNSSIFLFSKLFFPTIVSLSF